jgi:serine/threonine protein kinase
MIFGSYPFEPNSGSQMNLFKKICSGDIPLPQLDPPLEESAADFLKKLLKRDPKKRLGCGKKVGDQESNNGFDKLKFHPFLKDIDYDKLYLEKGPKVLKNIGATTMTPEVSVQSSTVNSSLSTSQANSTLQSKKTELICKVETKRKKFLFIDVVGHLLLFSDHTIRYDQVYDNSSVNLGSNLAIVQVQENQD